jgi:Arc/MetJ-type ribon-helix-helix transcriptional regulator
MISKKKVQVSVTLDKNQLAWMDKEIAENRFATRSHAIVYALTRLIKEEAKISEQQGNFESLPIAA